ncbi:MAG: hypothetical protein BGO67_04775 [Alphaproteobacteria bacterium 41-28]|nr:MAG: hypothetical protein BGO67_04775 [Alphaproteobacteria bacterium 41-28]
MHNFTDVICFEQRAKEALPQEVFNYFADGCGEELTFFDNVSAYDHIRLAPRILRDVSSYSLSTSILEYQSEPCPHSTYGFPKACTYKGRGSNR